MLLGQASSWKLIGTPTKKASRAEECSTWTFNWKDLNFTYLLNPWSTVILEKLTGFQLGKKFPAFYWTRRFISAFTSARQLSLSRVTSIKSINPHPTSWRSILILSSHLRLGLPSGLFHSGFPTKTLCTSLPSSIRATCPAHLILLDFINRTILGEEYRELSSSLCNFLHSPVTPSLLDPNILLDILFLNTLSLCSSLKGQFCIMVFIFWNGREREREGGRGKRKTFCIFPHDLNSGSGFNYKW